MTMIVVIMFDESTPWSCADLTNAWHSSQIRAIFIWSSIGLLSKMACSFIDAIEIFPIPHILCKYLPHSMHPKCKVLLYLNLRVVCRAAIIPISSQIPSRCSLLFHHARTAVCEAAQKIRRSGILEQLLMPGKRQRCLVLNQKTGIPRGMTQEYWENRQRQKLITGWTDEGKLEL